MLDRRAARLDRLWALPDSNQLLGSSYKTLIYLKLLQAKAPGQQRDDEEIAHDIRLEFGPVLGLRYPASAAAGGIEGLAPKPTGEFVRLIDNERDDPMVVIQFKALQGDPPVRS
jgi:hypothetical protein